MTTPLPVLDRILRLDAPQAGPWLDYLERFAPEDVAELARIVTDPDLLWADMNTAESWAPVHAWRALGQLRAVTAVEALVSLLPHGEHDDWILGELPEVFNLIGPDAVPALAAFVSDPGQYPFARSAAGDALSALGSTYPDHREACVQPLVTALGRFEGNDASLNGLLISSLMDLGALEAAPVMEAAFAAGRVDLFCVGDWEDVRVELGLLPERLTPRPRFEWPVQDPDLVPELRPARSGRIRADRAKAKAQRKAARKARRRNRHT